MQGERRIERLGKRTVDAAKPAAEVYRLWDSDLKGFGLKVTPRGVKTYFLWYRGAPAATRCAANTPWAATARSRLRKLARKLEKRSAHRQRWAALSGLTFRGG